MTQVFRPRRTHGVVVGIFCSHLSSDVRVNLLTVTPRGERGSVPIVLFVSVSVSTTKLLNWIQSDECKHDVDPISRNQYQQNEKGWVPEKKNYRVCI